MEDDLGLPCKVPTHSPTQQLHQPVFHWLVSWKWLLLLYVGSLWHFLPEESCLITIEYLLGNKSLGLYVFLKFCYEIISSYFVRTGSLPTPHYRMNATFLKFIKPTPTSLKWNQFQHSFQGCLWGGQHAASSLFHTSLPPKCYNWLPASCLFKSTTFFLPVHLPVIVVLWALLYP